MSVTVKEALDLNVLSNARIVAGRTNLNQAIRRVSFIDSPITPDIAEKGFLMPGDFFISSFFVVKDKPEGMLEIVRLLFASKSSGLCIIGEFFLDLPDEVRAFADEHGFPILFIDHDIPYADVIQGIFELIRHDTEDAPIAAKLEGMLESVQTEESVRKTILDINAESKKYLRALYCGRGGIENRKLSFLKSSIRSMKGCTCIRFREGVLILLTVEGTGERDLETCTKYALELLKQADARLALGVSNLHTLGRAERAIVEALIASESNENKGRGAVYYNDLGLYKLLLPLKDNPEFKEFHDDIIAPIREYDRRYKQNLLDTAICFVDCDGSFSKTAEKMFMHENSIRYRIRKIAEILGQSEKHLLFYAQLAIVMKLHTLHRP